MLLMVTLMTFALCEKDGRVGVTGLEMNSSVDGVTKVDDGVTLEFLMTFEEEDDRSLAVASKVVIVDGSEVKLVLLTLLLRSRSKGNSSKSKPCY